MNNVISLKDVRKEYKLGRSIVRALRGVNLELQQGGYYSIIGPSGSGKSSLLYIIGCMDLPTSGEVRLNGKSLVGLKQRELTRIRGQEVGFVFQAFHLNPILTARDNVAIALRFLGVKKRAAREQAEHWLEKVGLAQRMHHHPAELSGGERQRVAIARAIVKKPALILADEPTGNLDTKIGLEIIQLIRQINRQENTTIVQVTHDMEVAGMSDVVFTLRDGMVVNQ